MTRENELRALKENPGVVLGTAAGMSRKIDTCQMRTTAAKIKQH